MLSFSFIYSCSDDSIDTTNESLSDKFLLLVSVWEWIFLGFCEVKKVTYSAAPRRIAEKTYSHVDILESLSEDVSSFVVSPMFN
tara:strand:+ start:2882 stop:3133 length:252 start_codon:yes stop_codon:yes gene_type:complete